MCNILFYLFLRIFQNFSFWIIPEHSGHSILRHMVVCGRLAVVQSKVDAIRALPEAITTKLLRSYLDMCAWLLLSISAFIFRIASLLSKLTKGVKQGAYISTPSNIRCISSWKMNIKLTRWALHTSYYDLQIHHKSDSLNTNSDCLCQLIWYFVYIWASRENY